MRITVDLINSSNSYLNPLKERELDLRGKKISAIENLGGVARDHDCIDFTDNNISRLENFPLNPRLSMLLVAKNSISSIQPNLAESLPGLKTLVLTENQIQHLADLDPLAGFTRLDHLTLRDNAVTRREHYRLYLIWRIPSLRILDFNKVRDAERKEAVSLFGTIEEPSDLAKRIMSTKSSLAVSAGINGTAKGKNTKVKLTDEERAKLLERARNAKSFADFEKLEREVGADVMDLDGSEASATGEADNEEGGDVGTGHVGAGDAGAGDVGAGDGEAGSAADMEKSNDELDTDTDESLKSPDATQDDQR